MANDLTIYSDHASDWWSGTQRFLRLLHNLVIPRLQHFDEIVGDWHGQRVLDLGCGGGFMADALARRGACVTGVDPSAPAIDAARTHAQETQLDIDYRVGVGEAIPCEDHSFDIVVCVDVLEHVADLDQVLDEVNRVLKPGGLFLFDTIHRSPLATLVVVYLGEYLLRLLPVGTHDPKMFIKRRDMEAYLAERHFSVGPIVGLGPTGINRRLDLTFGRLPFTGIMYMGHATRANTGDMKSNGQISTDRPGSTTAQ
ncbi:MAG: bifunctional 2-polyprenyl-6-hydroxyphenol methylase/3-demethylubiquinol 3-O-methyltransferase UbiG [Myxococcota bacterium]|nr:bifunctional 2-polyprenyl-6-hydroxyphenol methylase/3-demethylubiquinol 3-O-methyltransferase UbiG [Myxococcota bacterium]